MPPTHRTQKKYSPSNRVTLFYFVQIQWFYEHKLLLVHKMKFLGYVRNYLKNYHSLSLILFELYQTFYNICKHFKELFKSVLNLLKYIKFKFN